METDLYQTSILNKINNNQPIPPIPLSSKWIYYYHDLKNTDWSSESYNKLAEINTVQEYWGVENELEDKTNHIYFLFKNNIPPQWELEENKNGGAWSFRIPKDFSNDAWEELSMLLIGQTLTKNLDDMKTINGISITPKVKFCILKIWNTNSKYHNKNILNKINTMCIEDSIYRPHSERPY
jgi:hypothetical protein